MARQQGQAPPVAPAGAPNPDPLVEEESEDENSPVPPPPLPPLPQQPPPGGPAGVGAGIVVAVLLSWEPLTYQLLLSVGHGIPWLKILNLWIDH